jgi:hypothetical protein
MIDTTDFTSYLRRSKLRPARTGADAPDLAPDNSAAERQAAISARPVEPAPEGLGSAVVNALSQVGSAAITKHYGDAAAKSQAPKLDYNTAANPFQQTNVPRGEAGLDFTRPRVNQGRQLNTGGMMPMFGRGGTLRRNGEAAIVGDAGPELAVKDEQGTHVLPLDVGGYLDEMKRSRAAQVATQGQQPSTGAQPAPPATAPYSGQMKRADETLADQLRPAVGSSPPPNAPGAASPSPDAQTCAPRVGENPAPSLPPAGATPAGVDFRPDEPASRGRIAEPVRRLNDQLNYELANPEHSNHKHKWLKVLEMAGIGAMQGAASQPANPIAGAIGGAAAGGVVQGVRPDTLAQMQQGQRVSRLEQKLNDAFDREKKQLAVDETRADIGVKRANERWLDARPDLEGKKAAEAAAQRERNSILANLRLLKGQRIDPSNPRHARILERAADAGIEVDPDAWNNSASNLVPIDVVDPQNPTQKRRQFYNKASGEITDVGQSSYVAPIHKDTELTSNQEGINDDRDDSRKNLERHRGIQDEFSRLRIRQGDKRISLLEASQDNRLSEQTRRELREANKLSADAERYQQAANDLTNKTTYKDPETGEERESKKWAVKKSEYDARAAALRQQLIANYGYLFSPGDDGVPEMSTDTFSRLFPSLGGNYSGESQRLGVRLTDAGGGQNPVSPSVLPRRGAPAHPHAAATAPQGGANYDEATVRARASSAGKDPDAAVRAARAAGLIK